MQLYYLSVYLVAETLILVILPISPTPKIGGGIVTAVIIISLPSFLPSFLTDRPTDPSTIFSSLPIPIGTKIFFFSRA